MENLTPSAVQSAEDPAQPPKALETSEHVKPKKRRAGGNHGNHRNKGDGVVIDPKMVAELCDNLALSLSIEHACDLVGLPRKTYYNWQARAAEGIEPYASFMAQVTRAKSEAVKMLTIWALAGGKGSMGAQFLLERRYREHYGPPRQKIEHSGPDGGAIEIAAKPFAEMSEGELLRLANGGTE